MLVVGGDGRSRYPQYPEFLAAQIIDFNKDSWLGSDCLSSVCRLMTTQHRTLELDTNIVKFSQSRGFLLVESVYTLALTFKTLLRHHVKLALNHGN